MAGIAAGGGMITAWQGWLLLLVLAGLWTLGAHNRVTALKSALVACWSQVDAALQTRGQLLATLLPRLAEPLAGESAAIDAVAQAQAELQAAATTLGRAPLAVEAATELGKADAVLAAVLVRVLALVGRQPQLLADAEVAAAMQGLQALPPRLQFARQLFNEAGEAYNLATTQFPTRLLGSLLRFGRAGRL